MKNAYIVILILIATLLLTTVGCIKQITQISNPNTVTGIVIGGGDTTPQGLMDAPRKFVYEVERKDETRVNVSYTAYPPSPAGDIANKKITLEFYNGTIQPGDYIEAHGTYDKDSNTIIVANQGDYIRTYAEEP